MLIRVLAPLSVALLCGATLYQIVRPSTPRLLYNPSPSAPVGWYRVYRDFEVRRGLRIAADLPEDARRLAVERRYLPPKIPLIKTVWAVPGEDVCHVGDRVEVDGRPPLVVLSDDQFGRTLPRLSGCYRLGSDEVFLVSNDVQTSFDSRYFGPVGVDLILGQVEYLGRFKSRLERIGALQGAGRG